MSTKEFDKTMKNGEALIWDSKSGEPFADFLELCTFGLAHHFGYNFIVMAYYPEKKMKGKEPVVAGACRGHEEVGKLFIMFSDSGLVCVVDRIKAEHAELTENVSAN